MAAVVGEQLVAAVAVEVAEQREPGRQADGGLAQGGAGVEVGAGEAERATCPNGQVVAGEREVVGLQAEGEGAAAGPGIVGASEHLEGGVAGAQGGGAAAVCDEQLEDAVVVEVAGVDAGAGSGGETL